MLQCHANFCFAFQLLPESSKSSSRYTLVASTIIYQVCSIVYILSARVDCPSDVGLLILCAAVLGIISVEYILYVFSILGECLLPTLNTDNENAECYVIRQDLQFALNVILPRLNIFYF